MNTQTFAQSKLNETTIKLAYLDTTIPMLTMDIWL